MFLMLYWFDDVFKMSGVSYIYIMIPSICNGLKSLCMELDFLSQEIEGGGSGMFSASLWQL